MAFIIIFALIGTYLLFSTFASPPVVATLQAEQMSLAQPKYQTVVSDSAASAGQAVKIIRASAIRGTVTIPAGDTATSLAVTAKATQCAKNQSWPTLTLSVDGNNVIANTAVNSTNYQSIDSANNLNLAAGTHSITINTNNFGYGGCNKAMYVDVTNFYGPTPPPPPAPTVSISANPTTVTSGNFSTITYTSSNVTSCTASGSWGIQVAPNTSNTFNTGSLTNNASYTLTCTGAGGTATGTASVTVAGGGGGGGTTGGTITCTTTLNAPAAGSTTDVIAPAIVNAHDGDNICLNSGTYPSFNLYRSHHAAYVTLAAAPGAKAILGGGGSRILNSSFIRFQNLNIADQINVQDADPTLNGNGPTSHDMQFIHDDITGDSGPRMVAFGNDTITNLTFQSNYIHDIEAPGIVSNPSTQSCTGSAGTDGQGITLAGTDNVLIQNNTFKSIAWHYIQGGGTAKGVTVDHNLFTGPEPANTLYCAHLNAWQVIFGGVNDTFSNNVVIGSDAQGTTPVANNSLMFENGTAGSSCTTTMTNTVVDNNLFVDQNVSYEFQLMTTTGLTVTNNTVVGSSYGGLVARSDICGNSTNVKETNNIITNNTNGNSNFSFGGCSGTCNVDYNVSQDKSAGPSDGVHSGSLFGDLPGTSHYVTSWTPKWQNTSWTPGVGMPTPAGFYQPVGLPFQAGYQGSIGPTVN